MYFIGKTFRKVPSTSRIYFSEGVSSYNPVSVLIISVNGSGKTLSSRHSDTEQWFNITIDHSSLHAIRRQLRGAVIRMNMI